MNIKDEIFIFSMRKVSLIILLLLIIYKIPAATAAQNLSIQLTPETQYGQVWAYETYLVNISIQYLNLSSIDFTEFTETPSEILLDGSINWRGKGGYDFGEGTTGYNYNLDAVSVTETITLDGGSAFFNLTLEKDAYEYGMLPFETVEIKLSFDAYVVLSDDSLGPKITSTDRTFTLVDEMKVSYLEGKYLNMQDEINIVLEGSGLNSFNRARYQQILDDMNNSLAIGNYVKALDVWDDYNDDDREDMINGLIRASNIQYSELSTEIEELRSIEGQLEEIQTALSLLHIEYNQLESTYNTLSSTYLKVNAELDVAQRNFSTAITAVFLTAIVFYFLGRRGIKREEAERIVEPDIY